jgi:hypothetical protein
MSGRSGYRKTSARRKRGIKQYTPPADWWLSFLAPALVSPGPTTVMGVVVKDPGPKVVVQGKSLEWVYRQAAIFLRPIMLGWPYETMGVLERFEGERHSNIAGVVLFDGEKLSFSKTKGPRQAAA